MVAMASITSINSVYVLSVAGVIFPTQLQGFSADDIFSTDPLEVKEVVMGVDGRLSAGRVNVAAKQGISIQADSPSIQIFEIWNAAERVVKDTYFADATISFPSIGRKYACSNGVLTTYPLLSDAGKTLKVRRFAIVWESITPAVM